MSEIRVTSVVGENGSDPVGLSTGFTVGPTSGTTATITHEGQVSFTGIVTATSFVPTVGQLSHRNIIINGAMLISQRGTSASTTNGYGSVDRVRLSYNSSGVDEAPSQIQSNVSPPSSPYHLPTSGDHPYKEGFRKCFNITNGNQTSGAGADDFIKFQYRIEAQDIANSGWNYTDPNSFITLSFWIKSSVAQNFYGYLETFDTSGYLYPFETGSLSAFTWKKVTKTIPGNSNLTVNNDNGSGLQIEIQAFMGTNSTDSGVALNTWAAYAPGTRTPDQTSTWFTTNDASLEITGLQLEVGSVSTPFEHRSYGDELTRCRRYCYTLGFPSVGDSYERVARGQGYDSTRTRITVFHPTEMRAKASSVTIPDISHWQISDTSNAYLPSAFELTPNVNGVLSTGMQFTHASGATAYRNYFLERRGTTAGKVIINAEL
tara:strand:- start:7 stop:1302 length:1296 start_codon:yes stop_codon:yes gene_type:complete